MEFDDGSFCVHDRATFGSNAKTSAGSACARCSLHDRAFEGQEAVVFVVAQAAEHGGEAAEGGLGADAAGIA